MAADERAPSCPSAQPDMDGARVFGVLSGTPEAPRIAYLKAEITIDPAAVDLGGLPPTQVFRFAARCEASRCVHFNGQQCTLAARVVERLPEVVEALPACTVRPTCRWYLEQGAPACRRCPQVVTMVPSADADLGPPERGAVAAAR
jgi:hypothetical protein